MPDDEISNPEDAQSFVAPTAEPVQAHAEEVRQDEIWQDRGIEQEARIVIPEKIKDMKKRKETVPENWHEDGHEGPMVRTPEYDKDVIEGTSMGHKLKLTRRSSSSYSAYIDDRYVFDEEVVQALFEEYDSLLKEYNKDIQLAKRQALLSKPRSIQSDTDITAIELLTVK